MLLCREGLAIEIRMEPINVEQGHWPTPSMVDGWDEGVPKHGGDEIMGKMRSDV